MKIVHVIAGIQETCGVSQFVMEVARAQMDAGLDVTVVTTMTCGYPIGAVDVRLAADPVATLDSVLSGLRGDVALVHVHNLWSRYGHRAAVWCRRRGVPYVVSPHGSMTAWALRFRWWKKLPALVAYQWWDLHCAAAFHVTAEREIPPLRRFQLSQPVAVAPLGVAVDPSVVLPVEQRTHDVVFVGRIHPVKNLDGLLRAWQLLKHAGRATRLVIAGSNDVGHQEELVALARSLGLSVADFSHDLEFGKKQIHGGGEVPVETFRRRLSECQSDVVFTGPVYAAAKDWMYAHARVSVLPSHTENFGGVVVEALAQGTPVIASRGTPWKVLSDASVGWWVEPTPRALADGLCAALQLTLEERRDFAARARAFVFRDYSWNGASGKLSGLYRKIESTQICQRVL